MEETVNVLTFLRDTHPFIYVCMIAIYFLFKENKVLNKLHNEFTVKMYDKMIIVVQENTKSNDALINIEKTNREIIDSHLRQLIENQNVIIVDVKEIKEEVKG